MAKKNFHLSYDPQTDILHVAFGKAKKSVSVEQEPEVFVRIDPSNDEVVGFTVLGFKQHFLSRKQDLTISPTLSQ